MIKPISDLHYNKLIDYPHIRDRNYEPTLISLFIYKIGSDYNLHWIGVEPGYLSKVECFLLLNNIWYIELTDILKDMRIHYTDANYWNFIRKKCLLKHTIPQEGAC